MISASVGFALVPGVRHVSECSSLTGRPDEFPVNREHLE
jgi:hypothetical protein